MFYQYSCNLEFLPKLVFFLTPLLTSAHHPPFLCYQWYVLNNNKEFYTPLDLGQEEHTAGRAVCRARGCTGGQHAYSKKFLQKWRNIFGHVRGRVQGDGEEADQRGVRDVGCIPPPSPDRDAVDWDRVPEAAALWGGGESKESHQDLLPSARDFSRPARTTRNQFTLVLPWHLCPRGQCAWPQQLRSASGQRRVQGRNQAAEVKDFVRE